MLSREIVALLDRDKICAMVLPTRELAVKAINSFMGWCTRNKKQGLYQTQLVTALSHNNDKIMYFVVVSVKDEIPVIENPCNYFMSNADSHIYSLNMQYKDIENIFELKLKMREMEKELLEKNNEIAGLKKTNEKLKKQINDDVNSLISQLKNKLEND